MKRPVVTQGSTRQIKNTAFTCPHCGVLQVALGHREDMSALVVDAYSCQNCQDIMVEITTIKNGGYADASFTAYPKGRSTKIGRNFHAAPVEVQHAYEDACTLFSVHTGASGAYARRALELILDNAGYEARSLAESIQLARDDGDPDRRLPKRLLQKLDYIKEIGNFALHIRRDDELTIVTISEEEVSTCLETIEDLTSVMFEEPVAEYQRTLSLNEKLRAAGKREIALPDLPQGTIIRGPDMPTTEAGESVPASGAIT